jgi:hypothetical protein
MSVKKKTQNKKKYPGSIPSETLKFKYYLIIILNKLIID